MSLPLPVLILLLLGLAQAAGTATQAKPPDLPRLNMDNFLPAVRQQIEQASAAAQAAPRDPEAVGTLGMILDAYEQYDAALLCYERAHLLDPSSFRWLLYLGWVQATQGRHDDAVSTLGEALRAKPGYVPAQLKLAESLLAAGKWQESRDLYQMIGRSHPDNAEANYGLGRVYWSRGDAAAAAASYVKALQLFPEYGAANYALALAYRKLGDEAASREQLRLYEENRTSAPPLDDPLRGAVTRLNMGSVAHIRRGADRERAGDIAGAIAEQNEALRVDPRAVQAHINLIALYGRQGLFAQAAEHYRAALDLDRNQADLHYNYAVLLLKQHRPDEAEAAFRETLAINPHYPEAHGNLGLLYEQQGRLTEALEQFEAVIEDRPADRVAHFHAGRILANQGQYDAAIQHFLKTLTPQDEKTPRYLYALAATWARAGRMTEALTYARSAREQAVAHGQSELLASIDKDFPALAKEQRD